MNPEIQQPAGDKAPMCIIDKCEKEARWKGLCSACYGQAKQLIDAQETTWEELGLLGLAIIPDKPFVAAFKAARAKAGALPPP